MDINNNNMTSEQLKELEEKAKLWDSLSNSLLKLFSPINIVFDSKPIAEFKKAESKYLTGDGHQNKGFSGVYGNATTTIQNTSNASTFIDVLKEEFNEGICSCNLKKCECLTQNNN